MSKLLLSGSLANTVNDIIDTRSSGERSCLPSNCNADVLTSATSFRTCFSRDRSADQTLELCVLSLQLLEALGLLDLQTAVFIAPPVAALLRYLGVLASLGDRPPCATSASI